MNDSEPKHGGAEKNSRHPPSEDALRARSLADLENEIAGFGKRRCDRAGSVDNLKYELGAAFQVHDALHIDPVALTGLLDLPFRFWRTLDLGDGLKTVDAIGAFFTKEWFGPFLRTSGQELQWERLKLIYEQEVEDFEASPAAKRKLWRRRPPTRRQLYLVSNIVRVFELPSPKIINRGEASDFISHHGGNPRFIYPNL